MTRKFGTHRTVYLIGSWAIKVPVLNCWRLFLHGLLANRRYLGRNRELDLELPMVEVDL